MNDFFRDSWLPLLLVGVLGGLFATAILRRPSPRPEYTIVEIENCRYIKSTHSSAAPLVHLANCPNH